MEQYFKFLLDNEWIHNFQLTSIFQDHILHHIPESWHPCLKKLSMLSLNEIPFLGETSKIKYPDWPPSLHDFLLSSSKLCIPRSILSLSDAELAPTKLNNNMARGMNPKKLHEVSYMASLVHNVVLKAKCDLIVDIGSGLGYLGHVLHQVYGHRVLGLETDQCHTSAAEKRATKQGIDCGGVRSMQFKIEDSPESRDRLQSLLQETHLCLRCQHYSDRDAKDKISNPRVCLIGLHCCGDLSTSMLSLFHNITCVQALCYVCCCYHKMAYSEGRFKNFPLSDLGKRSLAKFSEHRQTAFISPFTLRLGAQETRCRWQDQTDADHESHIKHVAFRGLLDLTDEDATDVRQRVRKCDFSDFDTFLHSYFSNTSLPESEQAKRKGELKELHAEFKDDFNLIEVITALQVVMQPVIETTVYQDRIQWLHENGYSTAQIIPIFEEIISPRNLAIQAIK